MVKINTKGYKDECNKCNDRFCSDSRFLSRNARSSFVWIKLLIQLRSSYEKRIKNS